MNAAAIKAARNITAGIARTDEITAKPPPMAIRPIVVNRLPPVWFRTYQRKIVLTVD
jgi:hypothetical protein